ncbi:MAG: cyclic 2,3-diphosphoglycerate synthase [Thermofilaceae archaeon]|nr:cyclic 2,3-diphosphoglycerate synthase [Thermofilaceae archaeon]MCX8180202.1 cyclic 2,3-diphosphoglycerate synthase [Thermofilaceae archaeon]MDW8004142.1 cyclic 2,3-diphosphoglycerate synthase [Thermofilaceae archaeon]
MNGSRRRRVIIMGAGGRDFHNFNVFFRNRPEYEVVAFTAAQIPNIDGRLYPPELAGPLYPNGIPIYSETELPKLISEFNVDEAVLSYSDLLCEDVLMKMSIVLASGASFRVLGVRETMLNSEKPVIAVTATRTGAGKSTTSRYIVKLLRRHGLNPVVVRHPMAYGNLAAMKVQKISCLEELDRYTFTIEEREEFEWHVLDGTTVYAGVDYEAVLKEVEAGPFNVIIWDGGNNDWPFIKPDLHITVTDSTRPDHVMSFPGLVNLLSADVIVVNKINVADENAVKNTVEKVKSLNRRAHVVMTASEITLDKPHLVKGRKVVVVEDGPSVTHGHMPHGAGYVAALKYEGQIVDPRPYTVGSLKEVYEVYKHIGPVLPAMGYSERQMKEVEESINRVPADTVVLGTPTDLSRYMKLNKNSARVVFELRELDGSLTQIITSFIERLKRDGRLP